MAEKQQVILNYFQKMFTCLNDKGEMISVKGIPRKVSRRQISVLQMKKFVRKGCKVLSVHIINDEQIGKEDKPGFDDIPILQDFSTIFREEIPRLPPKRHLDFTIELVLGVVPNSKDPYRMDIFKLNKLKLKLQELIDKNYVRPCVSRWGAPILFVNNKTVHYFYV